jgi:SAM-dependent methyltransferase
MRETRRWWEETAQHFQAEVNLSVGIDWGPGVPTEPVNILPDLNGLDVVELGCGGGQLGVGIAKEGADQVVGVDLSRAQLEYAREHAAEFAADMFLLEGDIRQLPLAADIADLVVSAYAFQWIEDIEAVFAEAARILRPDGNLVFSCPHPFYGVFDPEGPELKRSYHEPGAERTSEAGISAEQVIYRRRISDLHRALRETGFRVERLLEPGRADPSTYVEQWASKPDLMAMVPRTLIIRARLSTEEGSQS